MKKYSPKSFIYNDNKEIVDVTILLNIWKREHLEELLVCILSQSVLPKEIWIIHYEDYVESQNIINLYRQFFSNIILIKSEKNLKYFGRFSIAINVTTKFIWLIDDDIIPGEEWLSNCVNKCDKLNSIISCTGRIIPQNEFQPENTKINDPHKVFVGDMKYVFRNYCEEDTKVDYACNSYFFKTEWLSGYWSIWPASFLSGEDIHLSATCKYVLGIDTYVIQQLSNSDNGNIRKNYGSDDIATWKQSNFLTLREDILRYHIIKNGWKPIMWK